MNNLYYCETITATNPCGEQPLPPYGACLLGSFNVTKYLYKDDKGNWCFNWDQLEKDIPHVVRAMDNVIDRARYPLPEQKKEALSKRRIGLGVTGLANALEAMGFPYGTESFIEFQDKLHDFITNKCYQASCLLAEEKGSFPMFQEDLYLGGKFVETLWEETIEMIGDYGIRNSHLISFAPTGTISFTADNCSSGVEPVIAYMQERSIKTPEGQRKVLVSDYGVAFLGTKGLTATSGDIPVMDHIKVLCTAQKHCDSAVSKTINVPTELPYNEFKEIYMVAWKSGAKGCTTYRPNDKYDEPIKAVDIEDATCGWDPDTGQRTGPCAD